MSIVHGSWVMVHSKIRKFLTMNYDPWPIRHQDFLSLPGNRMKWGKDYYTQPAFCFLHSAFSLPLRNVLSVPKPLRNWVRGRLRRSIPLFYIWPLHHLWSWAILAGGGGRMRKGWMRINLRTKALRHGLGCWLFIFPHFIYCTKSRSYNSSPPKTAPLRAWFLRNVFLNKLIQIRTPRFLQLFFQTCFADILHPVLLN